jgi:CHAD domain-containing protein/CYTH domain-containing protein
MLDLPMLIDERTVDLPVEEGARVVALGLLAEAREAAEALAPGADDEALHEFRVALRRLRSALRAFRSWLDDSVQPGHEKRLKKIAGSTNQARDADVQLAWLTTGRAALASGRQRVGLDLLVERYAERARSRPDPSELTDRFRRAARKLRRRLQTYERKVDAEGGAGTSFGGVLATLVGDQAQALHARMDAIAGASDREGVHRARIEGKRLRYLLEPLRGHRHADATEAIEHLKRLQDVLGELHDAHVLADELREALVQASAERARELHAALFSERGRDAAPRDRSRTSPRAGLVAVARLVRERRDALHADLEREWRARGMDALSAEVLAIAASLEARAGGRLERERRFLLAGLPPRAAEAEVAEIAQGWLPGGRVRERIRRVLGPEGERYWRAVEQGGGLPRLEAEEETTREVFETLWPLTEGRRIAKRRHRVRDGALLWEVDEFTDRELVVAGVELAAGTNDVALPDWLRPLVVREVTEEPAFLDGNLAASPGAPAGARAEVAPPASGGPLTAPAASPPG